MSPIFLVLLLVAVAAADEPKHQCGPNEVWSLCTSGCQDYCNSASDPDPVMCPAVCREGCACKEGYIRRSRWNGECILKKNCPPRPIRKCGANAVWNECGSACPRTCDNRNDSISRPCPAVCVRGCTCKFGYIRKSRRSAECILPQNCRK